VKGKDRWAHRKIQQTAPNPKIIRGEIWYGFWSSLISGGYAMSWVWLYRHGYTHTYFNVSDMGWPYFWFSVFAMVMLHDAYFYWTHRAFHHKKIYKIVHHAHHISIAPSPWAAWGFHPYETLVGGFYMFMLFLFMPMHPNAFFLYMLILTLMNVVHHLGYEVMPAGTSKHWLGRWVNWTTHHDLHHKAFNCNYGFYFGFWDSICGTHHKGYQEYFEMVTSRKPKADQGQGSEAVSVSESVLFTGKGSSSRRSSEISQ
jgi:sterol desaturase/sphingolipid hydroxylase (fatty acid hydroxylase superfamily)